MPYSVNGECRKCEPSWLYWDGSCYFVSQNKSNFRDALNECLDKKSYFLRIDEYSNYKYPKKMFEFLKYISLRKRVWVKYINLIFNYKIKNLI